MAIFEIIKDARGEEYKLEMETTRQDLNFSIIWITMVVGIYFPSSLDCRQIQMHLCPLKINRASLHCSPNSAISTIYLQSNSHWCWSWFSMPTKRLSTPNQHLRPSILDATYVDSLQRMNKFSKSGSNQETFIPAGVFLLPKRKLMSRIEDDWFYLHTQNRDSKKKRKQPKKIDREGERLEIENGRTISQSTRRLIFTR